MRISGRRFEALVADALEDLPSEIARHLANVEVVVAARPSRQHLAIAGMDSTELLLGLYEGVPLTERASDYGMVLPDRITLFRESILAVCDSESALLREVRRTVVHELAHHFGIDDGRLLELDAY